jgi:glutamate dehydrogenase (NAD(P)+)
MRQGLQEILDVYYHNDKIEDYRTAAYVIALTKVSRSYLDIGIY